MAFTLFQAATSLQFMKTDGTLTTLTLPTGVNIDSSKRMRATVFGRYAIVVNSPTRPLMVDADGVVRVLCPIPPGTPPTVSGVNSGALSGTYKTRYSYIVRNGANAIIAESPMSPESAAVTIASKKLRVSDLLLSTDTINAVRIYRTTTGGSTYFPWIDLDGNVQTATEDDLADATLDTVAAPVLGAPPLLTLIGEFRERLWGVSSTDPDAVYYTETSKPWSWPGTNRIVIPKEGADDRGVTAVLTRKENLAIARQNRTVQIVGDSTANFRVVKLSEDVGVEAADSVAVHKDAIFFLGKTGLYVWNSDGISPLCEGKTQSWFTTDTYFNRSRLKYAVGRFDPLSGKYQLLLSAAGSSNLDRWIEYDVKDQTFWGPHKTEDFTPTWMTTMLDSNTLPLPVIASSAGFFYKEQATRTDGASTGIALDVDGKFHDMNTPDIEKYFGQPALISKIQAAGTLSVTPYVGGLDAAAGTAISADMTLGRERLPRLGTGRMVKLNFQHSTAAQDIELFGYELEFHELGRR
jgi:hypothetical protein